MGTLPTWKSSLLSQHINSTQPVNQAWWTKWGNVYFFSTLLSPPFLGVYWSPGDPRAACQSLGLRYQWNVTYTTERTLLLYFWHLNFCQTRSSLLKTLFFDITRVHFISIKFWLVTFLPEARSWGPIALKEKVVLLLYIFQKKFRKEINEFSRLRS